MHDSVLSLNSNKFQFSNSNMAGAKWSWSIINNGWSESMVGAKGSKNNIINGWSDKKYGGGKMVLEY